MEKKQKTVSQVVEMATRTFGVSVLANMTGSAHRAILKERAKDIVKKKVEGDKYIAPTQEEKMKNAEETIKASIKESLLALEGNNYPDNNKDDIAYDGVVALIGEGLEDKKMVAYSQMVITEYVMEMMMEREK